MNVKDQSNMPDMVDFVIREYLNSGKDEIVIVNVGSDKCIGDCVGPIVGTLLSVSKSDKVHVYGSLDGTINAMNLRGELTKVSEHHPGAFVIGVDAGVGDCYKIGSVIVRDWALKPGKGVGKNLSSIGDISIVGVVADSDSPVPFVDLPISLGFVCELAKSIAAIINTAISDINKLNKNQNLILEEVAIND